MHGKEVLLQEVHSAPLLIYSVRDLLICMTWLLNFISVKFRTSKRRGLTFLEANRGQSEKKLSEKNLFNIHAYNK